MAAVRWTEIAEALRGLVTQGELRPGDRLPSEKVVAAQWGVCRMTAHRALSELEREGLVIRKRRVGTIVRDFTIHTPSPSEALTEAAAASLAGASSPVALLAYHTSDFPQVDYVHGFRAGLHEDRHMLLCDTGNDAAREAEYLRRLEAEGTAGIALYPTCAPENTPHLIRLAERGTHLVFMDRVPDNLTRSDSDTPLGDAFMTDNYGSSLAALRTLTAQGHRRIAMLMPYSAEFPSLRERAEAHRAALTEIGINDPAVLTRRFPRGIGYDFDLLVQSVHDALFTLLHERGGEHAPTALFCMDDFFLSAAMESCDRMGLSVPGDFEILSFSDYPPLAGRLAKGVHRIVQRPRDMGRLAAERLSERLSGDVSDQSPQRVRFSARLFPAGGGPPTDLGSPHMPLLDKQVGDWK